MARASDRVDADGEPPVGTQARTQAEWWEALARNVRTGDPGAARRLFDAVAPVVRRVCRGVLGDSHVDLEDAIQEGLLDVLRALPQYRSEGQLIHYVTKIAIRRAILARRRGTRRLRSLLLLERNSSDDLRETTPPFTAEQSYMISRVLARVSAVQGETLVLRVILGFTVDEIASMMSVSVNTVKTRLRLAKNTLRRLIAPGRTP